MSIAIDVGLHDGVAVVKVLPVSGDDEERVVDAHTQPDHETEELREVRDRDEVRGQEQQDRTDADPGEGDRNRQSHREHGPERDDQDDDGEGQAEHL